MKRYITLTVVVTILIAGIFMLGPRRISYITSTIIDTSPQATSSSNQVHILFTGDIMLGRNVELLMDQKGDQYPFEKISLFLKSFDTVVANLEGPVLQDHTRTPSNSLRFNFHPRMPSLLFAHNIGIVSLANNHTYDFGSAGYEETRKYVQHAGIDTVGHPFTFGDQYVLRKTIGNQKFVFMGFNTTNPHFEFTQAHRFVRSLTKNSDELVVALIHGGDEYELHSNTLQQTFYRGLIDDDVDLVIAHHPHVVQEIEIYKNRGIFYSLGNFIFDQYFEKNVLEGLTVGMTKSGSTIRYELFPTHGNHSQTSLMEGEARAVFLKSLAARSAKNLQTQIEQGIIELEL
jgi:gamma-polyglutamate biosynthesis protein CapA